MPGNFFAEAYSKLVNTPEVVKLAKVAKLPLETLLLRSLALSDLNVEQAAQSVLFQEINFRINFDSFMKEDATSASLCKKNNLNKDDIYYIAHNLYQKHPRLTVKDAIVSAIFQLSIHPRTASSVPTTPVNIPPVEGEVKRVQSSPRLSHLRFSLVQPSDQKTPAPVLVPEISIYGL